MKGPLHRHANEPDVLDAPEQKRPFRPSAPILLVVAAVVLIAISTNLSMSSVRSSWPSAITVPSPPAADHEPAGGSGPSDPTGAAAAAATLPPPPAPSTTATTAPPARTRPGVSPPTAVAPAYPVGQARDGGPSPAGGGYPTTTETAPPVAPGPTAPTTVAGAEDGSWDGSTQTVAPNYPVVTENPGSTTTTVPATQTGDR